MCYGMKLDRQTDIATASYLAGYLTKTVAS